MMVMISLMGKIGDNCQEEVWRVVARKGAKENADFYDGDDFAEGELE